MNEKNTAYSEEVIESGQLSNGNHLIVAQGNLGLIDSLLHPLAVLIRQVLTRSGRLERNLILIDDEENIVQALDAGVDVHSVYYSGGERLSKELRDRLPLTMVYEVAKRTCKKLFENDKVSRVFAIARLPEILRLDSLVSIQRDIVALEDLSISGNIGAIIRTSLAFGAGAIVLLNADAVDIFDRRTIRASRGHIFSLPILTAGTEEFIYFCRQNDISILVMAAQAKYPIYQVAAIPERIVIAFGSEKDGCSRALMKAAKFQVQIPTNSKVESLNVSTAAGIMLYSRTWFNIHQA